MVVPQVLLPDFVRRHCHNVDSNEEEVLSGPDFQWTVQRTVGEDSQIVSGAILRYNTGVG